MFDVWKGIAYVSSGLTLAAFVVAVTYLVLRELILRKKKLIETVAVKDRAKIVNRSLEIFDVPLRDLSPGERYDLVKFQIEQKARRFLITAGVIIIFAGIAASVSAFAIYRFSQMQDKAFQPAKPRDGVDLPGSPSPFSVPSPSPSATIDPNNNRNVNRKGSSNQDSNQTKGPSANVKSKMP